MERCPYCKSDDVVYSKKDGWRCEACGQRFEAPLSEENGPATQMDEALLSTKTAVPLRIFVSYAHAQNEIVERIIRGLTSRGHNVWFDRLNIPHGSDWRKKITDGVMDSTGVLSFLSREAIREGGVCLDELSIAVGIKYGLLRTVFLHKEEELKPIPAQLIHRQWLDMSDWKEKLAGGEAVFEPWFRKKLTEIILSVESDDSVEFAGDIAKIRKRLDIVDTAISRQSWYLSQPFTPREWLDNEIVSWLNDENGGHLCAVYGRPGTGKSAFAARLAYLSPYVAASLFFERGNSYFNSAETVLRDLVFQLACRLPDYRRLLIASLDALPENKVLNVQELFERMVAYPIQHAINGGHDRQVIVADGLDECREEDQKLICDLLKSEHFPAWLRVLVLCRPESRITGRLSPGRVIDLDQHADAVSRDIRSYYEKQLAALLEGRENREALLDNLTQSAGGVFLYASYAVPMILDGKMPLDDPGAFPKGLSAFFDRWFSGYFPDREEFNRFYRLPLGIIAACEDPVPLEELETADGYYDASSHSFILREKQPGQKMESVKKRLEKCAMLLKYETDAFGKETAAFAHRYLSDWYSTISGETGQSASPDYFCAGECAFWALETAWRKRLDRGSPMTAYQALHLLSAMENAGETLENIWETAKEEAWGGALYHYYHQYKKKGNWKICVLCMEAEQARCQIAFGHDHPHTLTALDNLALAYADMGRLQEALERQTQVYDASRRVFGPDHSSTLITMNNLASTYSELGNYQKALELQLRVCDACKRIFTPGHPSALTALDNLAITYTHLGRYQEAMEYQLQVYETSERVLGPEDPDTMTAMNNLALTFIAMGRLQDAMKMQRQVCETSKRVLGPGHPDTLTALGNLAVTCSKLGRLQEAVEIFQEVLTARKRVAGLEHPDTLIVMNNLAYVCYASGRLQEALEMQQQAYSISESILGPDHPVRLDAYHNMAMIYSALGRKQEALEMFRRVYEARKRILGAEHPDTLTTMNNMSYISLRLDRLDDALEMNLQAYEARKRILGPEHPDIIESLNTLSYIYKKMEQYEQCIPLFEQIISISEKLYGEESKETAAALSKLSIVLSKLGQFEKALPLMEKAYEIRKALLGEDHPDTAALQNEVIWLRQQITEKES